VKVYTIGYERVRPESYVLALVDAGVGTVLDVREYAWSYRSEFVKSVLERNLRAAGIAYIHCKAAGNPSVIRKTSKDLDECMLRYRMHLIEHPSVLQELLVLIREAIVEGRSACLTCYEREPGKCHRSVLVEELLRLEPQLVPIHLEGLIAAQLTRSVVGPGEYSS